MAMRDSTVLQLRVDGALKQAFADAAQREQATAADMLRRLMRDYVRDSKFKEAERQSLLVASAPDAEETMDIMMEVQGFARDRPTGDRHGRRQRTLYR